MTRPVLVNRSEYELKSTAKMGTEPINPSLSVFLLELMCKVHLRANISMGGRTAHTQGTYVHVVLKRMESRELKLQLSMYAANMIYRILQTVLWQIQENIFLCTLKCLEKKDLK